MIRWLYSNLVVIFYFSSQSVITAQYSVSVKRPCPMETVTFTCTAPGNSLRWVASNVSHITIRPTASGLNVSLMPQPGYTVTLIAFNDTALTSTLSRTAENGITVSCVSVGFVDPLRTQTTIGSSTIQLVDPPGPPSTIRHSTQSSSANEVSVSVQWDPPTETGGRDDLTYTVTVSPSAQLSATVLTSTSVVTVTAQYNVDYTVSVMATNCAGNSTTAEYNFRIGGCPVLINPMNGVFGPTTSSLPRSTVTIQCDAGYVSAVTMVTCEGTLRWSPDAFACTSLTQPLPTTTPPMNCTAPLSLPWNGTISVYSLPAVFGTQVTFQCDDGLFPEGIMTATCLATGEWDRNTGEIVCRNESISCFLPVPPLNGALLNTSQNTNPKERFVITFQCDPGFSPVGAVTATCNNSGLWNPDPALLDCETSGNVAVVAGGVIGGIVVTLVIILMVVVLLVVLREKREDSVRLKSNGSMEMDDKFDREYSELRHSRPKQSSLKPLAADNRVTHDLNPASLTYDEVTINSEKSTLGLPHYGQLGNVATVEPVVYAALSSSQPHKKGNRTGTVDQHQVTYATVDIDATKKQAAKVATLPASPTEIAPAPADVDKLLDIDQALVQIRSMKHKWRELAETVRLPETMIEQIEDSCCNDSAGCLTEVINQWSLSGQPTWKELADYLSKIGEEQLAKKLMTIYGTSCLPVELSSSLALNALHKYDKTPPSPGLPSESPTVTDDSPVLLNTLPPSRPPKPTGEMVPARPPKPAPNIEPPVPPRPFKH